MSRSEDIVDRDLAIFAHGVVNISEFATFLPFQHLRPKFASEAKPEIGIPGPFRALDCGRDVTRSKHQKERSAGTSWLLGTDRTLPGPRQFGGWLQH